MDQKVKDLVKWKNYYNSNKTKYLLQRLQKRTLKGCKVKYTTLLKYDMVGYYLQNANTEQLKVFEEQKKFYETMYDVTNLKGQTEKKLKNAIESICGKHANLKIEFIEKPKDVIKEEVDSSIYNIQSAIADIKHKSVNRMLKPLHINTKRTHLNYLYKLCNLLQCEEDMSILKQEKSLETILAQPNSEKTNYINLINSLHRYSIPFKTMMEKQIVMYKTAMNNIFSDIKKRDKIKRMEQINIEWSQIIEKYKDMSSEYKRRKKDYEKNNMLDEVNNKSHESFYNFQQMYLLFSLFVLRPPLRGGDYNKIYLVDSLPIHDRRHQNIVSKDKVTGNIENYYIKPRHTFVLQNYKTAWQYHQVWFEMTASSLPPYFGQRTKLIEIINESIIMFPRMFLLCQFSGQVYSKGSLMRNLSSHLKLKISANTFRHSFITYQYHTKNIKQKKKDRLAKLMLHSASTAENNYLQAIE